MEHVTCDRCGYRGQKEQWQGTNVCLPNKKDERNAMIAWEALDICSGCVIELENWMAEGRARVKARDAAR